MIPVDTVENGDAAVEAAASLRADLVLLDLDVPGGGLSIARRLKAQPQPPKVLLLTAFADESLLVPALIAGADGVLGSYKGTLVPSGGRCPGVVIAVTCGPRRMVSIPCLDDGCVDEQCSTRRHAQRRRRHDR